MRRAVVIGGISLLVLGAAVGVAGSGALSRKRGLPPEKAALLAHEQQVQDEARAQARGRPKPADAAERRPRSAPGLPPTDGIKELSAPFRANEFLLDSRGWQQVDVDGITSAFVGALGNDHREGVVVVMRSTAAGEPVSARAYPAPTRSGRLTIMAARGSVLTLRSESGKTLVFDVAERRYGD
jgi:hypothetical protein